MPNSNTEIAKTKKMKHIIMDINTVCKLKRRHPLGKIDSSIKNRSYASNSSELFDFLVSALNLQPLDAVYLACLHSPKCSSSLHTPHTTEPLNSIVHSYERR